MAAWVHDDLPAPYPASLGRRLYSLDVEQWIGGQRRHLSELVAEYPGRIDVYLPLSQVAAVLGNDFSHHRAVSEMWHLSGGSYGWTNLVGTGLRHTWLGRWFLRAETDDEANGSHPPFCSMAVAAAYRSGGQDPVPNLSDRLTEPGDLARSLFFRYQCTLTAGVGK